MNRRFWLAIFVPGLLLLMACGAHAQFGPANATGVNAAFFELFGTHTNFTATADVRILDKKGEDWARVPVDMAAGDKNLAMDIDLTKLISRDMPEFAMSVMKSSGLGRVQSITRKDKMATFLIYPGVQSYVKMGMSAEDTRQMQSAYKVQTTSAGKDSLAGKERLKNKVVVSDSKGTALLEATTWNAPELKNFPIQIETRQDNMNIILRFTNVSLQKPEAARFEIPEKFTEYKDVQALMFAVMQKIAAGDGK